MPNLRLAAVLAAASTAFAAPLPAEAAGPAAARRPVTTTVVLLPTAIAEAGGARAVRPEDVDLGPLAQGLDALLADTVQDLGLSVVPPAPAASRRLGDGELLARARGAGAPVVMPSLGATSTGEVELRLVLATPGGAVEVRRERVPRADLSLRAVVLLRGLIAGAAARPAAPPPAPAPAEKLAGRVTLMVHTGLAGGLAGFSVQRASGSDDPRLLYPLMIAGAGVGLGAAYLASGEWEVSSADAWYFASGLWWPTAAAHLVFQGRFAATREERDRWAFGLVGSGVGATLATLGLALHPMSDGGALLAHSGGAAGMLIGAFVEMGVRRSAAHVPYAGMGYGTALGWLAAAAAATQVRLSLPGKRAGRAGGEIPGLPLLGVIGESSAGARTAPIVGIGYRGPI